MKNFKFTQQCFLRGAEEKYGAAKSAFTLAEVLITLVIIGVIAALTVPTLIQNTQKQEFVSALKKVYSTLAQATQTIISEEGSPVEWAVSAAAAGDLYKKHLNVIMDCKTKSGCFSSSTPRYINGQKFLGLDQQDNGHAAHFVLADGAAVRVENWGEPGYLIIYVDVNGKKGPNICGRDIFRLDVSNTKGLYTLYYANCDTNDQPGLYCANKVLTEGAMNY